VLLTVTTSISLAKLPADFDRNPFKYLSMGINLLDAKRTPEEQARGVEILKALAERDDQFAQFHLAIAYEKGRGTPQDLEQAFYWYSQAAYKDYMSHVAVKLGDMLSQGIGTKIDRQRAIGLYQYAMGKHDSTAYLRLAEAYLDGNGVEQDISKGMALLDEAIKRRAPGAYSVQQKIRRAHELAHLGLQNAAICGDIPQEYTIHPYGRPLYAMLKMCRLQDITSDELLFLAGVAQRMLEECNLPASGEGQAKFRTLIIASSLAMGMGRQGGSNPAIAIGDMISGNTAFSAGVLQARQVECTQLGGGANALVKFLELDAIADPGAPSFVHGCVQQNEGRYSEKQCRCAADVWRIINPQIYRYVYDDQTIKSLTRANPFVGLQIAVQCGVGYSK